MIFRMRLILTCLIISSWFWMRSLTRSIGAAAVLEQMAATPERAKFSAKESLYPDIANTLPIWNLQKCELTSYKNWIFSKIVDNFDTIKKKFTHTGGWAFLGNLWKRSTFLIKSRIISNNTKKLPYRKTKNRDNGRKNWRKIRLK